jgi:pSer/pThr/pTyr-binding forkhead associated (FHA) protein
LGSPRPACPVTLRLVAARIVLTITEKGGKPREAVVAQNEATFGRVQDNDVVLPKGNISKRHARIVLRDGKLIIVDLKTTNGTFVNGKRISSPQVLRDGDKIYIGDFTIEAHCDDGAGARPDAAAPVAPPPIAPPLITPQRALPTAPPGSGPHVVVEIADNPPTMLGLVGPVVGVGRAPDNDIVIDDRSLSRRHARLERRGDTFFVVDTGAQNGVHVNGVRISGERALVEGDRIGCGRAALTLRGVGETRVIQPAAPPAAGGSDELVVSRQILAALRNPRIKEVELREGEPARVVPAELAPPGGHLVSRRVVLVLLHSIGAPLTDDRPVFDGESANMPEWRITAQALEGAPARARFRRRANLALDDDLDPIPPG